MSETTPLMKQYLEIKKQHPGTLLFFRVGDFYEMFYEDAVVASKILDIALTSRDKGKSASGGDAVPLCGVPASAVSPYIARLLSAGYKVAICEQMEDPATAKGLIKREVMRVITPGTILEDELLSAKDNNFLASIFSASTGIGLAFADLSTGEFSAIEWTGDASRDHLLAHLSRLEPKEVLLPDTVAGNFSLPVSAGTVNIRPAWQFSSDTTARTLMEHFHVASLNALGCEEAPLSVPAAGALLLYLKETHNTAIGHLTRPALLHQKDFLVLDATAQRNLELVKRMSNGQREGSLLSILDMTATAMGGRLLHQWLLSPLLSIEQIQKRQDGVEEFLMHLGLRQELQKIMGKISDMERSIARISSRTAHARDLSHLATSLAQLPEMDKVLHTSTSEIMTETLSGWDTLQDLRDMIGRAIREDPPPTVKEGGMIKEGYSPSLDDLREMSRDGKKWIAELEARERQRTGIDSLKIRYNQVFGYSIEVTRSHLSRVPVDYIRRQTLTHAERFVTQELKDLEAKVLGAEEKIKRLEEELFYEIRDKVAAEAIRVQAMAARVALLDVLISLAEVAASRNYAKPALTEEPLIHIRDGRHPVMEALMPSGRFVPNDTYLDGNASRLLMITGPNMAGKSTYLRQVALSVILAQMGSFVPAREASIGLVDRIFTRVGAFDNILMGESTFMVEMIETAKALNTATHRSLILLDEVGRGTSTYDGVSIAWAVAEWLHDRIGARTLFATHYHELTELAATCAGIKNFKAAVREWNDEIIFLRKIQEGGSDKSYGIHVARLAGLPEEVIERAKKILSSLEGRNTGLKKKAEGQQ